MYDYAVLPFVLSATKEKRAKGDPHGRSDSPKTTVKQRVTFDIIHYPNLFGLVSQSHTMFKGRENKAFLLPSFWFLKDSDEVERLKRDKQARMKKIEILLKDLEGLLKDNGIVFSSMVLSSLLNLLDPLFWGVSLIPLSCICRNRFHDSSDWVLLPEMWGVHWRFE